MVSLARDKDVYRGPNVKTVSISTFLSPVTHNEGVVVATS